MLKSRVLVITHLLVGVSLTATQFHNVAGAQEENCDPSYPDVCIASPPPDLNCNDIPYDDVRVVGDDPHGLDREGDGIGCES
jgi:hypothetical protein